LQISHDKFCGVIIFGEIFGNLYGKQWLFSEKRRNVAI